MANLQIPDPPNAPLTDERTWRDWFSQLVKYSRTAVASVILPLGYLRGDGTTSTITATTTIPATDISGVLPMAHGGTGTPYVGAANQYLTIASYGPVVEYRTLVAGVGVSITHTSGHTAWANTGVLSFNTRVGAVTLTSGDVTTALGFTPGTVTSVDGSGGTTGLTLTGGPITTSGTLTLGGTLAIANGGTGHTSYSNNQILYVNNSGAITQSANLGFVDSTNTLSVGSGTTITSVTPTGYTVTSPGGIASMYQFAFAASASNGMSYTFIGQQGTAGSGGGISFTGGTGTSLGGSVIINAGQASVGQGGGFTMTGGNGATGGGNVIFSAGSGTLGSPAANGGNITIRAGIPRGTGTYGSLILLPNSTSTAGLTITRNVTGTQLGFHGVAPVLKEAAATALDVTLSNLGLRTAGSPNAINLDYTNTATIGNVTINKVSGQVILGLGTTTLTLTNSIITANSRILLTLASDPGIAIGSLWAVAGAGTATINTTVAPLNNTAINFLVIN